MNVNCTELTRSSAAGWNTWNTRSVLSHVLLPQGVVLDMGIKEYRRGAYLAEALIGRKGEGDESVIAGPRTWDGAYTELTVQWKGIRITIETAAAGADLMVLVHGEADHPKPPVLAVSLGLIWNSPGTIEGEGDGPAVSAGGTVYRLYSETPPVDDPYIPSAMPYRCFTLNGTVAFSVGSRRSRREIENEMSRRRSEAEERSRTYGALADVYDAVHRVMAWDTVYDPLKARVISPVSRIWSVGAGGYVLFDWDTYFAALLAGVDNKEIAYANAVAITKEITVRGFIPNFAQATGFSSLDRSQPPVGSTAVLLLYERFEERELLECLFGDLLTWNRWWDGHRNKDGYLCWGSNPYTPAVGNHWETQGVGDRFGGALESGLDNSPMYDDIPFDHDREVMELADVGLMSLYIADCNALARIADLLGLASEAVEIRERGERYAGKLAGMWDDDFGLFLNVRTDTGERVRRLSPTHFYPLLAGVPSREQARRMIDEHFYNPAEFWGDWVLPSIARNDPAYADQNYWRGRIWAPMNFLVYLGLRNYDLPDARADLAERSEKLLLKEWREHGFVCENYNADDGTATDVPNSDRFYHWGALLGLIVLMERGIVY